ncbi:MAG: hypothetical protein JSR18_10190 [Proteobacteria bacterium]|nr:hypothetical protein [Pseudomonadota bacterium]
MATRTKEEAEAMADAILAAHRAGDNKPVSGAATARPARWTAFLIAGFVAGGLGAVLPAHSFVLGGIVGLAIAGVVAFLASRVDP